MPTDPLPSSAARAASPGAADELPASLAFASRLDCQQALREAIAFAADHGCRELWWCDADYADWPIGERAVVEALERWAKAHRRLTVLASSFDEVGRRHPRWVQFRRQWAHVVECRVVAETVERERLPVLLLAPERVVVRVVDPLRHRGSISWQPGDMIRAREAVDAIVQQSVEGFPASTLGL